MKHRIRKGLSLCLALVMTLGLAPELFPSAAAGETVAVGSQDIAYTVDENGVAVLSPGEEQLRALLGETAGRPAFLLMADEEEEAYIPGLTGAYLELDTAVLTADEYFYELVFRVNNMQVTVPAGALSNMQEAVVRIGLRRDTYAVFEICDAEGNALDWYDGQNAVTLRLEYPSPMLDYELSCHTVIDRSGGKQVPRSWYDGGCMYARIYSGGIFGSGYIMAPGFNDTAGHWAYGAIYYLQARGVVKGVARREFSPETDVTRAEFVTMLIRLLGVEAQVPFAEEGDFEEIPAWARDSVYQTQQLGFISGGDDFRPNDGISREDMLATVYRAMEGMGMTPEVYAEQFIVFNDWDEVSEQAREAIGNLANLGIAQGDAGDIRPQDTATRAEAAQLLYKLLQYDAQQ